MAAVASMPDTMPHAYSDRRAVALPYLAPFSLLALIWLTLYVRRIGELGLYQDDWWHLSAVNIVPLGTLVRIWPMDYRPLEMLPWYLFRLFGNAYAWYYGCLLTLGLITAALLYLLLRILGSPLPALCVAALWMVYPADDSALWLTAVAYRTGLLFLVLGLLLLVWRAPPRPRLYAASIGCCALCLLSNEIYLGCVLLLPLLAAIVSPMPGGTARLRRAAPYLALIGAYALYRAWLGPHLLHLGESASSKYTIHPSITDALHAEAQGLLVITLQAWQAALITAGHGPLGGGTPNTGETRALLVSLRDLPFGFPTAFWFMIEAYGTAVILAALTFVRRRRYAAAWEAIRPGAIMLALGLATIVLGYLSLSLTVQGPSMLGIDTRVNAAAAPGGALFMVGVAWVLTHWPPWPRPVARALFLACIVALLLLGYGRMTRIAATYSASWSNQQRMWREMLAAVPAVRPGTTVVVVAEDQAAADTLDTILSWGTESGFVQHYPARDAGVVYLLHPADVRAYCEGYQRYRVAVRSGHLRGDDLSSRMLVVQYSGAGQGLVRVVQRGLTLRGGCTLPNSTTPIVAQRS